MGVQFNEKVGEMGNELMVRRFTALPNDFTYEWNYIYDDLVKELDLEAEETVVINTGIGRGKSTTMYNLIDKYIDKEEYIILVAS